jgi:hypothetical protein
VLGNSHEFANPKSVGLGHCLLGSPMRQMLGLILLYFWWDRGLNSGLHTCKAGVLLLESHLQSTLLWLFWRWGLENYLSGLASNLNPPNLSLLNSWDYKHRHPASSGYFRDGISRPICLGLPPNLNLLCSWDYRHELHCLRFQNNSCPISKKQPKKTPQKRFAQVPRVI